MCELRGVIIGWRRWISNLINTKHIATQDSPADESPGTDGHPEKVKIRQSLQSILKSPSFRNSERCKQFLTYVVEKSVEGHSELLKERTIGVEVFRRSADYATGDDPIVRVQAGEVRRRLHQYYEASDIQPQVQIELPTGSYVPSFRFLSEPKSQTEISPLTEILPDESEPPGPPKTRRKWIVFLALAVLAALSACAFLYFRFENHERSNLDRFWTLPATSRLPFLICVAQPTVYLPRPELYQRYSAQDPRIFRSDLDQLSKVIPFKPDEKIEWGQLRPAEDLGVAVGDMYAAERVTTFLAENHWRPQARIGKDYTFEDLRTSPSVLIGAFDNRWSIQLTSKLRFQFVDSPGGVREEIPGGRIWSATSNENGQVVHDYAIVARLLDSETGQFTVVVAGLTAEGTQAAGELVTDEDSLRAALKSAPSGWEKRNVEIVIETSVTDLVASPPHVVASYFW